MASTSTSWTVIGSSRTGITCFSSTLRGFSSVSSRLETRPGLVRSYPGERRHALACGDLLAPFVVNNFAGANSLSFVSHSLGARLLLQTVTTLNKLAPALRIRQIGLMAGAINHDCLTAEYASAAGSIGKIDILASVKDEVLAAAFPIGNVFEGINRRSSSLVSIRSRPQRPEDYSNRQVRRLTCSSP